MARGTARRCVLAVAVATLACLTACTEAGLQAIPPPTPEPLDNLLTVRGQYCTQPAEEVIFPVKILFLLDQSASLQCTDSQNRRFNAINQVVSDLRPLPHVSFGFVGFSSWSRQQPFTRSQGDIDPFLDPAGGLGPATDYQGALATAIRILETDMIDVGPAERVRTRYVVILVSDGVPEPRCNAGCEDDSTNCSDGLDNDGDGLPDGSDPNCAGVGDASTHPDSLYGVCNTLQEVPDDVYVDMTGLCPAYNQPEQILSRVSDLLFLEDLYSAGDVTLHTVLLFSPQPVVEGVCPGASESFGYTHDNAKGLLQALAQAGGGAFRDVNVQVQDDRFLQFDFSSLRSEQWLTEFVALNLHARMADGVALDSDTDGLPDELELTLGTRTETADSDGDGWSDLFEHALDSQGFDPSDPNLPALACADTADFDGDRLLNCEEDVLTTDDRVPDSDDDGLLDWLELVVGTDPLEADGDRDLDFDGVLNRDEVRGATDPLVPDEPRYRTERIRYSLTDLGSRDVISVSGDEETRHCYDFEASDIPLVTPRQAAERGRNRILLYTLEKPFQLAGATARAHVGCVEPRYEGPTSKDPEDGVYDLSDAFWQETSAALQLQLDAVRTCVGQSPTAFRRSHIIEASEACLPPKVQLEDILYSRGELEDLLRRHYRNNFRLRFPAIGAHLFVPIELFAPEDDCVRPTDLATLEDFLAHLAEACATCEDYAAVPCTEDPCPPAP